MPELDAVPELLQHCTAPVLQVLSGCTFGVGVATARMAMEAMKASFANISNDLLGVLKFYLQVLLFD